MMRWIHFFFRMFITKRDPVDLEAACTLANRDRDGYVEQKIQRKEYPGFGDLPIELVAIIFTKLSYTDAMNLRQVNHQALNIYNDNRRNIKGPHIMARVGIEGGQVVISARPHQKPFVESTVIPEYKRRALFYNADVDLAIRLGDNQVTPEISDSIKEIFKNSTMEKIKFHATTVGQESKELLNAMHPPLVSLYIQQYSDNVVEVANVTNLQIKEELMFFQLESIVLHEHTLETINAKVTAASLPRIMECIEEWKQNRRRIQSWYFLVPLVQIIQTYSHVPISWNRSICTRHDGTGRLIMQSQTVGPQDDSPIIYQSVNWLCL